MATMQINTTDQVAAEVSEATEVQLKPQVPTRTVYSWHYYEREDQFEDLFERLNLKG